jgi:DNA-binding transcriptional LysR family regulator
LWEDASEPAADITISIRRFDDRPPDGIALWTDRLALLCAPRLLDGPNGIKKPGDILSLDRIFIHGRQEYWTCMGEALGIPATAHEKGIATNASNVALELAAAGGGCVAMQISLARIYLQRGLLVEPFAVRAASPWSYYLSENKLSKGSAVKLARDWIVSRAKEME